MGKEAVLPKMIDWDANPVGDVEWTCTLNQHYFWLYLGRAYWETYDEKYAEDFVQQLRGWLDAYPTLECLNAKYGWRSALRAAARMSVWFDVFCYFSDSPSFTIPDKISMLHSIAQHAEYLINTPHTGNALVSEMNALLRIGVFFPEFKNALKWRDFAVARLSKEIRTQVYLDGAQIELTPHYHLVSLRRFSEAFKLAKEYGVALPNDYGKKLEKMFEYLLCIVKPDVTIPMLNDSDYNHIMVKYWLGKGADFFARSDMRFVATGGVEGSVPKYTSCACPYAGHYINRTGWGRNALYLIFEAGPFGLHHSHEDKLLIDAYAYGRSLLMDPGRYTYVSGPWRRHFLGTKSHNTITVDGAGQRRRQTDKSLWVTASAMDNRWISNEVFDFAVGSYSDGYEIATGVIHVRRILFVKDAGYWIISDRLYEMDADKPHEFGLQFQFSTCGVTVDPVTKIAKSHNENGNLMIIPIVSEKVAVDMFEGQIDPPRGWIGWDYHKDLKTPASQVVYRWKQFCPSGADVILIPYKGQEPPKVSVKLLPEHGLDKTALEIESEKGTQRIVMSHSLSKADNYSGYKKGKEIEIAVWCYDHKRNLEFSSVVVDCIGMPESKSCPDTLSVDRVNDSTARISWSFGEDFPDINRINVDYGHEEGGGLIFRKSHKAQPSGSGEMVINGLSAGRRYLYRAWAEKNEYEKGFLIKEGVISSSSFNRKE
jgi:hypothetical protein